MQLKGRVACQISSHELLLTELLFENVMSPLAPEESAALLSCLVFTQKTQVEPHLTSTLKEVRTISVSTAPTSESLREISCSMCGISLLELLEQERAFQNPELVMTRLASLS